PIQTATVQHSWGSRYHSPKRAQHHNTPSWPAPPLLEEPQRPPAAGHPESASLSGPGDPPELPDSRCLWRRPPAWTHCSCLSKAQRLDESPTRSLVPHQAVWPLPSRFPVSSHSRYFPPPHPTDPKLSRVQ